MTCERFHKEVGSVTERKPAGMSFETWVDKAIREAEERGAFTGLAGAGKPIPGAGQADDELWWVRAKLRRENLTFVPPSLALRKDVEEIDVLAADQRSEADVGRLVDDLNARIRTAIRIGIAGPAVTFTPLNPEAVVATWRERRTAAETAPTTKSSQAAPQTDGAPQSRPSPRTTPPARRRWFHRPTRS